jgi:hypothetical protein
MVERDPVDDLRDEFLRALQSGAQPVQVKIDEPLGAGIPWRPHVQDVTSGAAWHIISEAIESEFWIRRIEAARSALPKLTVGVVTPESLLNNEEVVVQLNDLGVQMAIIRRTKRGRKVVLFNSIADAIYHLRVKLTSEATERVLDRLLERCHTATTKKMKGVTLEVLTAVLLSQVKDFEVVTGNISSRSQQVDVVVHNRTTAGALGGSEIVIAEAKNWSVRVGTTEYFSVYRKIQTRSGKSRLGFFVTTDRFTRGVGLEQLRDSKGTILVVPIDKSLLPAIWRDLDDETGDSLTSRLENIVIASAMK